MWVVSAALGVLVVVTRLLPLDAAGDVVVRVAPVLAFLVAITVVAELADDAGVFDVAAREAAHLGRGRVWRLWLLVVLLATACTAVLSLDTTAVLLTPVVLAMARQLDIRAGLLAMTTVWLANTASLLLPVSNLTNLLALHQLGALGVDLRGFVTLTWAPWLAAVAVTVAVLAVTFRRDLRTSYVVPATPGIGDRVLFWTSAAVCLLLGPAFVTGVTPAWPAAAAALLLVGVYAWRRRKVLRFGLVPWRLVVMVLGLFLTVQALHEHGLTELLARAAGTGDGFTDHLRLAGTAAVGSNAVDNLPAYLALEPVADSTPGRMVALLIGTNLGPLVTAWGSLATLLWHQRCVSAGVDVSWRRFALRGLVLVPLVLVAATGALALTT